MQAAATAAVGAEVKSADDSDSGHATLPRISGPLSHTGNDQNVGGKERGSMGEPPPTVDGAANTPSALETPVGADDGVPVDVDVGSPAERPASDGGKGASGASETATVPGGVVGTMNNAAKNALSNIKEGCGGNPTEEVGEGGSGQLDGGQVSAGGDSISSPRTENRPLKSSGQETGQPNSAPVQASKAPERSASLGRQASKGPSVEGGTRKGRWGLKNQMKCRFCGGKLCLRCSEQCALRCKGAAVHGLHSHWITDSIIAMQRPSTRLIKTFDIVGQFKRKGVMAIFNLTEPGEHPHCGDGLEGTSGFPYLPETFMRDGIFVYNFAWEDMTTPSMSLLTDIVRVAVSSFRGGGKIAVHCHAGFGRTGLVVASILVMTRNLTAQQAVALVREKRPGSLQTAAQVSIVAEFANFVRGVRVVYHLTDHARVTLGQHLAQQAFLLHGQESATLRWLPKPVALATRILATLARERPGAVAMALSGVEISDGANKIEGFSIWGMAEEQQLKAMQYSSNANDWHEWEQLAEQCDAMPTSVDPRIPAQLMYDWLAQLAVPPITITELRRALPLSATPVAMLDEDQDKPSPPSVSFDVPQEGPFHRLNLLPVGQVRLLECLTSCLRNVREALVTAGMDEGVGYQKGCLRAAIALVHLHKVHEGLLVGRNIAPDAYQVSSRPSTSPPSRQNVQASGCSGTPSGSSLAGDLGFCSRAIEVLVKDWKAPLRCRPYGKLEALNNQPEIHNGNEEYWSQKRRSVVPPKDLTRRGAADGTAGRSHERTTTTSTLYTMGYTTSIGTINSADSFSNWGTLDDAAVVGVSANLQDSSALSSTRNRPSIKRRSISSDNVTQGLENVAPFDFIRPLEHCDPDTNGAHA